jgi:hypothetical protein
MQYVWNEEKNTGVWWEKVKEWGHLEDLGVDGRIILKCKLNK